MSDAQYPNNYFLSYVNNSAEAVQRAQLIGDTVTPSLILVLNVTYIGDNRLQFSKEILNTLEVSNKNNNNNNYKGKGKAEKEKNKK